jgi:hypothetical protein
MANNNQVAPVVAPVAAAAGAQPQARKKKQKPGTKIIQRTPDQKAEKYDQMQQKRRNASKQYYRRKNPDMDPTTNNGRLKMYLSKDSKGILYDRITKQIRKASIRYYKKTNRDEHVKALNNARYARHYAIHKDAINAKRRAKRAAAKAAQP